MVNTESLKKRAEESVKRLVDDNYKEFVRESMYNYKFDIQRTDHDIKNLKNEIVELTRNLAGELQNLVQYSRKPEEVDKRLKPMFECGEMGKMLTTIFNGFLTDSKHRANDIWLPQYQKSKEKLRYTKTNNRWYKIMLAEFKKLGVPEDKQKYEV